MRVDAVTAPAAAPAADPLREAARELHTQFVAEMLKQARLTEALGAKGAGEDGALASFALGALAEDVARAQPALTERLYQALARTSR